MATAIRDFHIRTCAKEFVVICQALSIRHAAVEKMMFGFEHDLAQRSTDENKDDLEFLVESYKNESTTIRNILTSLGWWEKAENL